ncbi:hypothetical protein EC988_004380, partial [Linderina pennispora]
CHNPGCSAAVYPCRSDTCQRILFAAHGRPPAVVPQLCCARPGCHVRYRVSGAADYDDRLYLWLGVTCVWLWPCMDSRCGHGRAVSPGLALLSAECGQDIRAGSIESRELGQELGRHRV